MSAFVQVLHKSLIILGLAAACICVPTSLTAEEGDAQSDIQVLKQQGRAFAAIVKQVGPAVVNIQVEKQAKNVAMPEMNHPFLEEFLRRHAPRSPQQPREYKQRGQGSGFIVSADGFILTNNHVIEDAAKITVLTSDEKEWEATLIGADPESDVALIKIEGTDLPRLKFGYSNNIEIGEWVLALGSPFGFTQSVTAGIVSAKGRDSVGIANYENFIQTDAAINPGNSGGPLVNLDGQVVGINTAIYSRSGGSMGIGFAIPIDMVKPIYVQLKENGSVERGFIGVLIQQIDSAIAEDFGLDSKRGALIAEVIKDSPAAKAGLKSGDVVLHFNGEAVKNMQAFRRRVAMVKPDQEVPIRVKRGDKEINLKIIVGKRDTEKLASVQPLKEQSVLGMSVEALSDDVAESMDLEHGVVISNVEANSAAAQAGLRAGMVILSVDHQDVKSVQFFHRMVKASLAKKQRVLLLTHNGQGARYVVVKQTSP